MPVPLRLPVTFDKIYPQALHGWVVAGKNFSNDLRIASATDSLKPNSRPYRKITTSRNQIFGPLGWGSDWSRSGNQTGPGPRTRTGPHFLAGSGPGPEQNNRALLEPGPGPELNSFRSGPGSWKRLYSPEFPKPLFAEEHQVSNRKTKQFQNATFSLSACARTIRANEISDS